MSRMSRQRASGRLTKKMAGTSTATKRSATKVNGGMSCRPASMTTKFAPQMTATAMAARAWRGVMDPCWPRQP